MPLFADIFGTVALRLNASETFVAGGQLGFRNGYTRPAVLDDKRLGVLLGDHPDALRRSFLDRLSDGSLNGHRYDLGEGVYSPADAPAVPLPAESIIRRQRPASPSLSALEAAEAGGNVALTVPWVYLDNLPRIRPNDFLEAAFRALGHRPPETGDSLWLHAESGDVGAYTISSPLYLSTRVPEKFSEMYFKKNPQRFPLVRLEYRKTWWQFHPRQSFGSPSIKSRVLPLLPSLADGLAVLRTPEHEVRAVGGWIKPERRRQEGLEKPTADAAPWPLSDVFSKPEASKIYEGRRVPINIVRMGVPVSSLKRIPGPSFHLALRWALGGRDPRENDCVVVTAGAGFAADGKLSEGLMVSASLPTSRRSNTFPKVPMIFSGNRWRVLQSEANGKGSQQLAATLLDIHSWKLRPWI